MRWETDAPVELGFEGGAPSHLEWAGDVWRVIDQPTQLPREVDGWHPLITHPPERMMRFSGWRFIARPAHGGDARTFDLFETVYGWRLCCVWD